MYLGWIENSMRDFRWYILLLLIPAAVTAAADGQDYIGDTSDGSRSPTVHILNLYDEQGTKILPSDEPLLPFSLRTTCGECHDYSTIAGGWHVNFNRPGVNPGRRAQPWIYADPTTATQIGLSYRNWPGVWHPEAIGMTPWEFALHFGRHLAGNLSEKDEGEAVDYQARWMESGTLEINCLACHDAEPGHDQSEYAVQIARENFRWAAPATGAFMSVKGAARDMPDMWDHLLGELPEDPKKIPPTVYYDPGRFDHDHKVFFDVSRKIPNNRCYFCHSNSDVLTTGMGKWTADQDVHLTAGLSCVDCHRNGPDHMIVRGYEGESEVSANPLAAATTCQGCHLGDESSVVSAKGRFAAPKPEHHGIPGVHFEKLTCTACHSGPRPEALTQPTQTSRAHGLGVHGPEKTASMLPHLYYPVYMRNDRGKIGPYKIFWPAFWGRRVDETIEPADIDSIRPLVEKALKDAARPDGEDWPEITVEHIRTVLGGMAKLKGFEGIPVYVAGAKVYALDAQGQVTESAHAAAGPGSWPIAHAVRPAEQALGEKSCEECHAKDAPFLFGAVTIDTPVVGEGSRTMTMIEFQGLDAGYMKSFASTFAARPVLKAVLFVIVFAAGLVLLLYGLRAAGAILRFLDPDNKDRQEHV